MRTTRTGGLLGLLLLVSCASGEIADRPTSVAPTPSGTEAPTVSAPATTEPPPSTTSTSTASTSTASTPPTSEPGPDAPTWLPVDAAPLVDDVVDCVPGWSELARAGGLVTFARDGAIVDVDPTTGAVACLARVDRQPTTLDWNPAGDRLLIDADRLLTDDGIEPVALDATGAAWTQPTGTALVAPTADGAGLAHLDTRDGTTIDIASLTTTWAAAYHPSGLAVASAGIDELGNRGLFLADNRGGQRTLLAFLEDPQTRITEVAFAPDGNALYFVHDHTDGTMEPGVLGHVHRLTLPTLELTDVATYAHSVPHGLRVSERADASIAWTTGPDRDHLHVDGVAGRLDRELPGSRLEIVGFVDDGTAAVLVRPTGAPTGPGDLWLVPRADAPVLVARSVAAATTRTERSPDWFEPPLRIEQQAVG